MNIAYFVWVRKRLEIVVFFCRLCRARPYFWVDTAKKLRKWPFGSVQSFCTATETLRTAERSFQRKNIGHAAEKQFWKGLRIEDFLLAGHKCTV